MGGKESIDLWGTCIVRDIFGIGSNKDLDYQIGVFMQNCSFVSAFMEHVGPDLTLDYFSNIKNKKSLFDYKCFIHDFNKTVLDEFEKSKSNWIILDFTVFSYGLASFEWGDGVEECITYASWNMRKEVLDKMDLPNYRRILPKNIDYSTHLDKLIDFLKKRYGKNVIVIETPYAYDYIDGSGHIIYKNPTYDQLVTHYQPMLDFITKTGCYYIKCPFNVIADYHHRWGQSQLHYVSEYYEYAMKALELIFNHDVNLDRGLDILYLRYLQLFSSIRASAILSINNTAKRIENCVKQSKYDEANALCDVLINQNRPQGYLLKSRIYSEGLGIKKDIELSKQYLREAIRLFDDPKSKIQLYKLSVDDKSCVNEMTSLLMQCVEYGDVEAYGLMGRAYKDGIGVKKNDEKARSYLIIASDNGLKWAKYELFDLYWDDSEQKYDSDMFDLLDNYAIIGDPKSCGRIGRCYQKGRGVKRDIEKAIEYLEIAYNYNKNSRFLFYYCDGLYEYGTVESLILCKSILETQPDNLKAKQKLEKVNKKIEKIMPDFFSQGKV